MVFVWYSHISNSSKAVLVIRLINNLLCLAVIRNTSETTRGIFYFWESENCWLEDIVLQKPFLFTAFYHWRSSDKQSLFCCSNFKIISYTVVLRFVQNAGRWWIHPSLGFFYFPLYITFIGYSWLTSCMAAQQCYFSCEVNRTFLSSRWQYISPAALGCMQALEMIVGRDKCHRWRGCSILASSKSIWKQGL